MNLDTCALRKGLKQRVRSHSQFGNFSGFLIANHSIFLVGRGGGEVKNLIRMSGRRMFKLIRVFHGRTYLKVPFIIKFFTCPCLYRFMVFTATGSLFKVLATCSIMCSIKYIAGNVPV